MKTILQIIEILRSDEMQGFWDVPEWREYLEVLCAQKDLTSEQENRIIQKLSNLQKLQQEIISQVNQYLSEPEHKNEDLDQAVKSVLLKMGKIEDETEFLNKIKSKIKEHTQTLIEVQTDQGGWAWPETFFKKSTPQEYLKDPRPWDTAMSLIAIIKSHEIGIHLKFKNKGTFQDLINNGLSCLEKMKIDDSSSDQSGWAPFPESNISIFETSIVAQCLCETHRHVKSSSKERVRGLLIRAVNLICNYHDWSRGGWSEGGPELNHDETSATSLALITLFMAKEIVQDNSLEKKMEEKIDIGLKWLEKNQNYDGGWGWTDEGDMPSLITKACDALSALAFKKEQYEKEIKAGIEWILGNMVGHTITSGSESSWGWEKLSEGEKNFFHISPDILCTSLAVSALVSVDKNKYKNTIKSGIQWLLKDEREKNWGCETPRVIYTFSQYLTPS